MNKNDRMTMMAELPVHTVLLKMSIPMMISFFIQAMYNIVDSMFVARISESALTAVSLAFPMQQIVTAISVGLSTGVSAVWSRYMGMNEPEKARRSIRTMTGLCLLFTAVFITLGLFASEAILRYQTSAEDIARMGTIYLTINWCFSCGSIFGKYYERLLVSAGRAVLSMAAMASGAVFNLIFDPLLIFGLGPFPALGVRGAAIATVIGQYAAAVCALIFNLRRNTATRFHLRQMLPDGPILKFIYSVGLPSMLIVGLSAVMSYCMNGIYLTFSTTATAVFGIWLKLQSFGFMPVFGMNNGTIAIYSYNYGAGNTDRLFKTLRLSLVVGALITTAVAILYICIPNALLSLFDASDYMRSIGVTAVRICALSMPFGAITVILSSPFQSVGRAPLSLLVNICRQLVFQVAAAWVLSRFGRLEIVWLAPLIAEALTMCIAALLSRRVMGDVRREAADRLPEPEA